jgi:hypothetical protein
MAEAVTQQVGTARLGPRPLVVSPGHCLSSSLLLAPWVFWQNRIFAVFFEIFPESWISAQKQDTRAILLKIALVRVSCIQNTQIRGETITKVFGEVDTFWTYQLCSIGEDGIREKLTVGALIGDGDNPTRCVMSTHASVLVDSVGPPSAEVCRTAASFP